MKLRWQIAIGLGAVCLLAIAAIVVYRKSSQTELDRYKAELRAKGEKLTLAELLPSGSEEPVSLEPFKEVVRSFSTANCPPEDILGLDFTAPGMVEPLSKKAHLRKIGSDGSDETRLAAWEVLEKQLGEFEPSLQKLRAFVKQCPSHMGGQELTIFANFTSYGFIEQRNAGRWLIASAVKNLHAGETGSYVNDLDALLCLAHMHSEDPLLLNQLVRCAIVHTSFVPTWEGLAVVTNWTDSDLEQLQKSWERIDGLRGLELGLQCERNFGIEIFESIKKDPENYQRLYGGIGMPSFTGAVADSALLELWRGTVAHQDQLLYLRHMQRVIESYRHLIGDQNWNAAQPTLETLFSELDSELSSWRGKTMFMSQMTIPAVKGALKRAVQSEVLKRLCVTAIALKRYQLQHSDLPLELQALVPKYLSAVPIDCMDGQPLRYKLQTNDTFLLYSVGLDGEDNGGDPTPSDPSRKKLDLWSGRDAVWPKLVPTTAE